MTSYEKIKDYIESLDTNLLLDYRYHLLIDIQDKFPKESEFVGEKKITEMIDIEIRKRK